MVKTIIPTVECQAHEILEFSKEDARAWVQRNWGPCLVDEFDWFLGLADEMVCIADTPYGTILFEGWIDDVDPENVNKSYDAVCYLIIDTGLVMRNLKIRR